MIVYKVLKRKDRKLLSALIRDKAFVKSYPVGKWMKDKNLKPEDIKRPERFVILAETGEYPLHEAKSEGRYFAKRRRRLSTFWN